MSIFILVSHPVLEFNNFMYSNIDIYVMKRQNVTIEKYQLLSSIFDFDFLIFRRTLVI